MNVPEVHRLGVSVASRTRFDTGGGAFFLVHKFPFSITFAQLTKSCLDKMVAEAS